MAEFSELVEVIRVEVFPSDKRLQHCSKLTKTFIRLISEVVEHRVDNCVTVHRLMIAYGLYVGLRKTIVFEKGNNVVLCP